MIYNTTLSLSVCVSCYSLLWDVDLNSINRVVQSLVAQQKLISVSLGLILMFTSVITHNGKPQELAEQTTVDELKISLVSLVCKEDKGDGLALFFF